ncbi:MAG: hypothetical protein ACI9HI_002434 [Salinirussus sp.]
MNTRKLLGGLALAALAGWTLLTVATLAGVGGDGRLPGSNYQVPGLVTAAALLAALTVCAALGRPWRALHTPYW